MGNDYGVYCIAAGLIREYGGDASDVAAEVVSLLSRNGREESLAVWKMIHNAVVELEGSASLAEQNRR